MGYNAVISFNVVNILTCAAGGVCVAIGMMLGYTWIIFLGCAVLGLMIMARLKSYFSFRQKCNMMLEAIKNGDYTFKFSNRGLSWQERMLQDLYNQLGEVMMHQRLLLEQREAFYGLIMSRVATGIVVLDKNDDVLQNNDAAIKLLRLPVLRSFNQLERYKEGISAELCHMTHGESKRLDFNTPSGLARLLVSVSEMKLGEKEIRIYAINDIKDELDSKELESWIKLTRVLTHEIMNSVAPIVSLSNTFLERNDAADSKYYEGMKAIHDVASGLMSFVDYYRVVSTLQQPKPEPFYLKDIVKQIEDLKIISDNISFSKQIEPADLMIYADPNLIRQVLINVIKNAVQAVDGGLGRIFLRAYVTNEEHVLVYVSNNGSVIPADVAENIFIPFFTTKIDGNGVGLSLSRQIMNQSGGSISLLPAGTNGWNTTFLLEFE